MKQALETSTPICEDLTESPFKQLRPSRRIVSVCTPHAGVRRCALEHRRRASDAGVQKAYKKKNL
jgi:hypothetical protein